MHPIHDLSWRVLCLFLAAAVHAGEATPVFKSNSNAPVQGFANKQSAAPEQILVAVAKPDQTAIVSNKVTLVSVHSRLPVEKSGMTYKWKQIGGPIIKLQDADTATASFVPAKTGVYRFNLTIKAYHQTSTDTGTVNVVAQKNIINGTFTGGLSGWTYGDYNRKNVMYDPKGGIDESGAVKMTVNSGTSSRFELNQNLQLLPNRVYMFKAMVRGQNVVLGKANIFDNIVPAGPSIATDLYCCDSLSLFERPHFEGTFGWTPVAIDFATGRNGLQTIALRFGGSGMTGTVWFDNVIVELDPETVTVESPLFYRHFHKAVYDKLPKGQAEEYVDAMGDYYREVTGVTGFNMGDFEKPGVYLPRYWTIYAGAWGMNPIEMAGSIIDRDFPAPGTFKTHSSVEVGALHELCHLMTTREMGLGNEIEACLFFIYVDHKLKGFFDDHTKLSEDPAVAGLYDHWRKEWYEERKVGLGMNVYRWMQIADTIGWKYLKRFYRTAVVVGQPKSASARLWKEGIDYPSPSDEYLYAYRCDVCPWLRYLSIINMVSKDSGVDLWTLYVRDEKQGFIEAYCNCGQCRPDVDPFAGFKKEAVHSRPK